MFNNGSSITGSVLTVITLVHNSFACVISAIVFIIIIHHQGNQRTKLETRIHFILCANIYLLICLYTATILSLNIQTLLGDLYGQNFHSSWCPFRGYFIVVLCCALYNAFAVQVRIGYAHIHSYQGRKKIILNKLSFHVEN
jgi:hypothetical protein